MLDALGGLAPVPARIEGHYIEHDADAALRCVLLRALIADRGSFRLTGLELGALGAPEAAALRRAG